MKFLKLFLLVCRKAYVKMKCILNRHYLWLLHATCGLPIYMNYSKQCRNPVIHDKNPSNFKYFKMKRKSNWMKIKGIFPHTAPPEISLYAWAKPFMVMGWVKGFVFLFHNIFHKPTWKSESFIASIHEDAWAQLMHIPMVFAGTHEQQTFLWNSANWNSNAIHANMPTMKTECLIWRVIKTMHMIRLY